MAASLTGCGSLKDDAVVVKAGDEEITAGVANFYARYTQAQYETYFASYFGGDDMWTKNASDGKTYEESIKETLLDDLKNMALLEKHMKDYDVKLTKADKKAINDAAEEFDKANSQKKKDKVSGSEENVKRVMTLMVIEQKMRSAIVAEANVNVTDEEAVEAFEYLSKTEGIIPAIESAHAVAYARKIVPQMGKDQCVVITISGRGDKDCAAIARYRGEDIHE